MPNIVKRILSALLLIALTLVAIIRGDIIWLAFIMLGGGIAGWEWGNLSSSPLPLRISAALTAAICPLGLLFFPMAFLIILPVLFILSMLFFPKHHSGELRFGVIYIVLGGLATLSLHQEYGPIYLIYVIGLVAIIDSASFIAGKIIGGKKILPSISPGKTWVGTVVGWLVGGLVMLSIGGLNGFEPVEAFLFGWLVALIAQGGDFALSALKRQSNIKDTGRILPGHGGILDRIDSHLAVLPVIWGIAIYAPYIKDFNILAFLTA